MANKHHRTRAARVVTTLPRRIEHDREVAERDRSDIKDDDSEQTDPIQQIADISRDMGTGVQALREVIDLILSESTGGHFRLLTCVHIQLDRCWQGIERVCFESGASTATDGRISSTDLL